MKAVESFVIDVNDFPTLEPLEEIFYGQTFDGWNANFDSHVLDTLFGKNMRIDWWDGMIVDALLYQGMAGFTFYHSLAWASDRYLGTTLTGKGTTQTSFTESDPLTEEQERYAAEDAVSTLKVCNYLREEVRKLGLGYAVELELNARPLLDHMERNGIPINWDSWQKVLDERERNLLDEINSEIAEILGMGQATLFGTVEPLINPASTPDLKRTLNQVAQEAVFEYTEHNYGTPRLLSASDKLDSLALRQIDHPLAKVVLKFKESKKILSTYGANLKAHVWDDGRMRPQYMQVCGTGTGRLSSRNPNAQNLTPLLKPHFQAPKGRVFVYADLSQAELRFLAELSGDEVMRSAFREGRDIHEATAEAMFGVDMAQLKEKDPDEYKERRARGKAQPLDEPVLTPTGWVNMGDLKVGDEVVGSSGGPTVVTGVYPQGKLDTYLLTFDDGSSTRCSLDHLWKVDRATHDVRPAGVVTLRDMLSEGIENDWRPGLRKYRWQFPFLLDRKLSNHETQRQARWLVSVEKVAPEEMQCISVDAEDSLYVTKDFVLTHNTLNFGIVYGFGGASLAKSITVDKQAEAREAGASKEEIAALELTPEDGYDLIDAYKAGYPQVASWLDARARLVKYAVAGIPQIDWANSILLYETLKEIGYAPSRYSKAHGHRPDGMQLAKFVDQYANEAQLRRKASLFEWAMGFESAVVLVDKNTPYTFFSYTDSGRRRHFNVPMDRIYEACIQLMLRSDKQATRELIIERAAEQGAVLTVGMSNDEIFEVFKGRGKNVPDKKRVVEACGRDRKPWVLEDLMSRALASRVGSYTNAVKNHPIQGGVGDAVLLGYANIYKRLLDSGLTNVYPVQTVHDSVTLECDEADAETVRSILQSSLEDGLSHFCPNVPAKADALVLRSLSEADIVE